MLNHPFTTNQRNVQRITATSQRTSLVLLAPPCIVVTARRFQSKVLHRVKWLYVINGMRH